MVFAHSMGNNVFRYFLEWLKLEIAPKHYIQWLDEHIHAYFAVGISTRRNLNSLPSLFLFLMLSVFPFFQALLFLDLPKQLEVLSLGQHLVFQSVRRVFLYVFYLISIMCPHLITGGCYYRFRGFTPSIDFYKAPMCFNIQTL